MNAGTAAIESVALAAGGTGGHLFPARALAATLLERGCRVVLMTDRRGAGFGGELADLEVVHVDSGAIAGTGLVKRARSALSLVRGVWQARRALKKAGTQAVVGFGGYASVPPVVAARLLGRRVVVHEQNAVLGRANRLLAHLADALATAFPAVQGVSASVRPRVVLVGNPVRPEIARLAAEPYPQPAPAGPLSLLVTGGSQGASAFDSLVPEAIAVLPSGLRTRIELAQQVRGGDLETLERRYRALGIEATLAGFFDDMPERLARAHMVICRAGASTVAELALAGRPAVMIPYPHATDDHQRANAAAVEAAGGGLCLTQDEATPAQLASVLEAWLANPYRLAGAAAAQRRLAAPEAAERLADLVLDRPSPVPQRVRPGASVGAFL